MLQMLNIEKALLNLKQKDAMLEPFFADIKMHLERYKKARFALAKSKKLSDAINGHLYFGFHKTCDGWVFREWLPGADAVWLFGDFNGWNKSDTPLSPIGNGVWEVKLSGKDALMHGQYVKLFVKHKGYFFERLPAYIRYAQLDDTTHMLCGRIWMPEKDFEWTDDAFYSKTAIKNPLIYEAHVGMAQDKYGIGTYREFADIILPRIKKAGYNAVQLMAIQEHPYYASFGYQVTNFFAPSHHFGEPEDLKYLINTAHGMGIAVILDVVHSHACPNESEGLNKQDGTDGQYFLEGSRGWHDAWKTRCFDYGKTEVLHFLLSNLKYWQYEFHFDGFRFDGVTSMLYEDHGLGTAFTDYSQYYSLNTNVDARVYLTLANELIHSINKNAITIAEDMSGMPGMCLPLSCAGFGFDYRLSMGIPDMWIKLIKETAIENWNMFYVWHELTGGRYGEKTISYAESHDQAMVGDKTIIFRLADAEMYTGMMKNYHTPSIDTAIDMHKLIRFLTAACARNGYLNFMGNEFGHPEWIDFPREGNGWSYHYARRQWSLADNPNYKYEWLSDFDRDMTSFVTEHDLYEKGEAKSIFIDDNKNVLVFERNGLIFVFNLHPTQSQESVFVSCKKRGSYRAVFSSDKKNFGGYDRISDEYVYHTKKTPCGLGFEIYLPCRSCAVLEKIKINKN